MTFEKKEKSPWRAKLGPFGLKKKKSPWRAKLGPMGKASDREIPLAGQTRADGKAKRQGNPPGGPNSGQ